MRRFKFLFLLLSGFFYCKAGISCNDSVMPDTLKPTVITVVNQIASYPRVCSNVGGFGAVNPPQYLRYIWLSENATSYQLLELLNDPNPIIKVYAFWALKARNHPNIKKIVLDHISDTLSFELQEGCDLYLLNINLYFLKVTRNLFSNTEFEKCITVISKLYKEEDWKFIPLRHRDINWSRNAYIAYTYPLLQDTLVISKPITDELAGSAYRKRATQYQIVTQFDTSKFAIIISESNKNDFDHEGSVYLYFRFDEKKSFREQKAELNMLIEKASEEYKFDSLKNIYFLDLVSLGDLNIDISRELENNKNQKLILKNYWKLNDFLLESSLSKEMNDIFKKYKLTVKQFTIEHFSYSPAFEILSRYGKIETKRIDFPAKIMIGTMWIYFD